MKTLGLIGGTSWVSTIDYYTYINKQVNERLGGINSAKMIMYSMNMEDLFKFANAQDWEGLADFLTGIAKKLEVAGAKALVICANTPHIVADAVQQMVKFRATVEPNPDWAAAYAKGLRKFEKGACGKRK